MEYSEDIKLEIGGKFINGDYNKNLKLLTQDLDKLIKSAKSELSQCKCGNTVQIECDDCKDYRIRTKYA